MPEYSTTTITPSGSVKVPAMNGATPGNFDLDALKAFVNTGMMPEYDTDDSVWDTAPTSGSVNAVTSGGVHTAIANETADRLLHQTVTDRRLDNLEQVAGEYVTSDMQDYSSVPTGKATYALVETMKGVSRVENQMVKIPSASISTTQNDVMLTDNRDGSFTLNGTASADCTFSYVGAFDSLQTTTTYLLAGARTGVTLRVPYGSANDTGSGAIMTVSASVGELRFLVANGTSLNNVTIKPLLTDLTLYFNGNIPTNADTVAHIAQYYPELLEPRAYNAGEIVDSTYTKVESVGVNIFDEVMSIGGINSTTGQDESGSGLRSDNYIPVTPSETYYIRATSSYGNGLAIFEYDANKNYLGVFGNYFNNSFSVSANTHYIRFTPWGGTTYDHDIQICLNSYADKTTYHPYMTDTLPIPSVTLKGAGSASDTLDVESGEITRRIGVYNVTGNEDWNIIGSGTEARAVIAKSNLWGLGNGVSNNFVYGTATNIGEFDITEGYVRLNVYGKATTNAEIKTWLQNHPTVIYYPLATHTTESVTPTLNNTLKTEGGGSVYTDADVDGQFTIGFLNL